MGKLVVTEFVTLDGVAQAPGAPDEDREEGFAHGGWQAPLLDADAGDVMFQQATSMDALLLGRKTYDIFASYWPTAPDDIPFKALLNNAPKYVATRTLRDPLAWENATVVGAPLEQEVENLKQRYDEVHVIGSLGLVQSLLRSNLVDVLELWVHPVLLGTGKHVFGDGTVPTALRLTNSATYPSGTVQLTYETAGAPTYGTVGA